MVKCFQLQNYALEKVKFLFEFRHFLRKFVTLETLLHKSEKEFCVSKHFRFLKFRLDFCPSYSKMSNQNFTSSSLVFPKRLQRAKNACGQCSFPPSLIWYSWHHLRWSWIMSHHLVNVIKLNQIYQSNHCCVSQVHLLSVNIQLMLSGLSRFKVVT
jgi:hypothetical protein